MARHINWEEARSILRKLREEQVRDGDTVVQLWERVLMEQSDKLGDESWMVHEQVCIAALDCQRLDLADACIETLESKFPHSIRVQRLWGMYYEAEERYEKADDMYQKIIEQDSTNMFARKRQVAILKAQQKTTEAIEKLNEYLKKFMTDYEAWMELCDLYLEEHDYNNAAFCVEELIMSNPHNHLFHQKYAEIRYTQGGNDNMEQSRAYFSQAVKLNPNNTRALYGLFLAATSLAMSTGKGLKEKQMNSKYAAWAAEQIVFKYKSYLSEEQLRDMRILESIEKMLESLNSSVGS
ncbi:ER membrane protein complex subunit 2-like [Haliotis rubra]|uniref:ER membrane protein complex subunit 2-like n=1 Tax=Haliotis rubra TaxID=36100 RepID=UPI001EE55DBC|nr:ER membrane protein complex subunit 2-like [Haliotis rubra]